MKIPVGRVNEVLKQAKRQDLEQLKAVWGELLGRLKAYNKVAFAVLLENSEPVAASDDTYVLAFQYEIHCKMASENREAMDTVEQALFELLSKRLNMIAIPKSEWGKIREDFYNVKVEVLKKAQRKRRSSYRRGRKISRARTH